MALGKWGLGSRGRGHSILCTACRGLNVTLCVLFFKCIKINGINTPMVLRLCFSNANGRYSIEPNIFLFLLITILSVQTYIYWLDGWLSSCAAPLLLPKESIWGILFQKNSKHLGPREQRGGSSRRGWLYVHRAALLCVVWWMVA